MHTRKLTLSAIASALMMVIMLAASLIKNEVLVMAATVIPAAIVIECGRRWGFLTGIVTALLSVLFLPDKQIAILYACFFAYYPVIKSLIENMNKRWLEAVLKTALFAAGGGIYIFIGKALGMEFVEQIKWYIYPAAVVMFWLYDVLLSGLIDLYITRISKYIRKIRKG